MSPERQFLRQNEISSIIVYKLSNFTDKMESISGFDLADDQQVEEYVQKCITKKSNINIAVWARHFLMKPQNRIQLLTNTFEERKQFYEMHYNFLEPSQRNGMTLKHFGIPHYCGEVSRDFLSAYSHLKKSKKNINRTQERTFGYKKESRDLDDLMQAKSVLKHHSNPYSTDDCPADCMLRHNTEDTCSSRENTCQLSASDNIQNVFVMKKLEKRGKKSFESPLIPPSKAKFFKGKEVRSWEMEMEQKFFSSKENTSCSNNVSGLDYFQTENVESHFEQNSSLKHKDSAPNQSILEENPFDFKDENCNLKLNNTAGINCNHKKSKALTQSEQGEMVQTLLSPTSSDLQGSSKLSASIYEKNQATPKEDRIIVNETSESDSPSQIQGSICASLKGVVPETLSLQSSVASLEFEGKEKTDRVIVYELSESDSESLIQGSTSASLKGVIPETLSPQSSEGSLESTKREEFITPVEGDREAWVDEPNLNDSTQDSITIKMPRLQTHSKKMIWRPSHSTLLSNDETSFSNTPHATPFAPSVNGFNPTILGKTSCQHNGTNNSVTTSLQYSKDGACAQKRGGTFLTHFDERDGLSQPEVSDEEQTPVNSPDATSSVTSPNAFDFNNLDQISNKDIVTNTSTTTSFQLTTESSSTEKLERNISAKLRNNSKISQLSASQQRQKPRSPSFTSSSASANDFDSPVSSSSRNTAANSPVLMSPQSPTDSGTQKSLERLFKVFPYELSQLKNPDENHSPSCNSDLELQKLFRVTTYNSDRYSESEIPPDQTSSQSESSTNEVSVSNVLEIIFDKASQHGTSSGLENFEQAKSTQTSSPTVEACNNLSLGQKTLKTGIKVREPLRDKTKGMNVESNDEKDDFMDALSGMSIFNSSVKMFEEETKENSQATKRKVKTSRSPEKNESAANVKLVSSNTDNGSTSDFEELFNCYVKLKKVPDSFQRELSKVKSEDTKAMPGESRRQQRKSSRATKSLKQQNKIRKK